MANQNDIQNMDFRGLEEKHLKKFSPGEWRFILLGIVLLGFIMVFIGRSQINNLAIQIGMLITGFGVLLGLILEFMFRIRIV